jgi:hydrogenase maturation protease
MIPDEQLRGGVSAPPRKVLILGVGNILLGDDGFGVHLINSLADTPFPPNVQILEAGTVSHQLIPLFRELDNLIVIDAVQAGDTPGSIFRFSPEDMQFPSEQMVSLHQISLIDVLRMAELTGSKPETVIIGVQPKDVSSWSLELSDEVRAVMPKVKQLIMEELQKCKIL